MKRYKRLVSCLLVAAIVFADIFVLPIKAEADTSGDYEYTVENGEATITDYTGSGGDITIPSALGGYPVTTIGEDAFYNCDSLTSVTIPDSVTTIGDSAFSSCYNLTDVYYSGNRTQWNAISIGESNSALTDATIHYLHTHDYTLIPPVTVDPTCTEDGYIEYTCAYGETYREPLFALGHDYSGTVTVVAPTCTEQGGTTTQCIRCDSTVTTYQDALDHDYSGKVTVVNPTCTEQGSTTTQCIRCDSTETTYQAALDHDYSGTVTVVAPTCTEQGYTLTQCIRCDSTQKSDDTDLVAHKMVLVPAVAATCTESGLTVGTKCEVCGMVGVAQKEVAATGHSYVDNVCSVCGIAGGTCGDNLTWTLDDAGTLTISGTGAMTNYGYNASSPTLSKHPWANVADSIKSVVIANGVTTIGNYAFYNCDRLTSVTIPDSVQSIGNCAFYNCNNLQSGTIPGGVDNTIDFSEFFDGSSLESVIIPDSVTTIGNSAFYNCDSLTGVIFPDSVQSIGNYAFSNCDSLTSVIIPDSVQSIGKSAFRSCYNLTGIWVDANNPNYSSDDSGVLYNKDKTILLQAPGAISGAYSIPDSVTTIGSYAFNDCIKLTDLTIGNRVTTIENYAFMSCSRLTTVDIPDSVTTIGEHAFNKCGKLTVMNIPAGVTSIGEGAFWFCSQLTGIWVDENNTAYANDAGGVLYSKDGTVLLHAPAKGVSGDYTIPDSVTTINDGAFWTCANLTGIWVSDNNTAYSSDVSGALFNKDKTTLLQVPAKGISGRYIIPDSVTTIERYAFRYCDDMTGVTIPDSVITINSYAFIDCDGLISVTVPDSVTSIGVDAFSSCSGLSRVVIGKGVAKISTGAFQFCNQLTNVYYTGSEEQWSTISIGSDNDKLTAATVHYDFVPCDHDYTADVTTCGTCGYVRGAGQITAATLRPTAAGIYFKGNFVVGEEGNVVRYGIAVSLENKNPVADGSDSASLYTAAENSVLIKDILDGGADDAANGKKLIYARAYVLLDDGTYIYGDTVVVNLKTLTETIDTKWDNLSNAQQTALYAMYTNYSATLADWNVPNIQAVETTSCPHCADVVWTAWDGVASNGHYYLTNDIVLDEHVVIASGSDFVLDLRGYTVSANDRGATVAGDSAYYGGVFNVNGNLSIMDTSDAKTGLITGGKAARGGNIFVNKNGSFTLYGGTISGGVADNELGARYAEGERFDANGVDMVGRLKATTSGRGGNIFSSGGTVTVKGGTVTGGTALNGSGYGGNICLSGGTLTVAEGTVISGGSAKSGGNIYLMWGNMVMTGGQILNGTASYGRSICTQGTSSGGYSTVTISGGTVDGSIYLSGGTYEGATYPDYRTVLNLSGGSISEINAYRAFDGKINVSGNPVVEKLILGNDVLLNIGEMTEGALINISTMGTVSTPFASKAEAEAAAAYITHCAIGVEVVITANFEIAIQELPTTTVQKYCTHCGATVDFKGWLGVAFTKDGHYFLEGDLQLIDEITVSNDVVIDLNGYTVTAAENCRVFYVNGNLSVMDSSDAKTGTITGGSAYRGGNIYVNTSGDFTLYSGTISNGVADTTLGVSTTGGRGGNIYGNGGTVALKGGVVSNGSVVDGSEWGGNIFMTSGTLYVEDDAVISGGNASTGGNVYLMYAAMVMTGGEISDGSAKNGSGVYLRGSGAGYSALDISGGIIDGHVMNYEAESTITVSGNAQITDLSIKGLLNIGELTEGASIKINATEGVFTDALTNAEAIAPYFAAVEDGYNVVVNADNKLEVVSIPKEAYCAHCGQAVTWTAWDGVAADGHYFLEGAVTLTESVSVKTVDFVLDLNGQTITADGCRAFYVTSGATLSIVDSVGTGVICGGTSTGRGGNIYASGANIKLYGGSIYGGTCPSNGGNEGNDVAVYNGVLTINGNVTIGQAYETGYAVYIFNATELNLTKGTVTGGILIRGQNGAEGRADLVLGSNLAVDLLALRDSKLAAVEERTDSARIAIKVTNGANEILTGAFSFTLDNADAVAAYFTSADAEKKIVVEEGVLKVVEDTTA